MNLAAALEMTLYDGKMKKYGEEQLGAKTGDPRTFASYDDFWNAYCAQQENLLKHVFRSQYIADKLRSRYVATPLSSALHDLCMQSCRDLHSGEVPGGVRLGFYDIIGFATVIDSLAAIKKLVYEEKAVTMAELLEALEKNFAGKERIRQMLLHAPKFGNNDHYVDEIGRCIEEQATGFNRKYRSAFGASLDVRYVPLTAHIPMWQGDQRNPQRPESMGVPVGRDLGVAWSRRKGPDSSSSLKRELQRHPIEGARGQTAEPEAQPVYSRRQ